jgi:hypothetical protein
MLGTTKKNLLHGLIFKWPFATKEQVVHAGLDATGTEGLLCILGFSGCKRNIVHGCVQL